MLTFAGDGAEEDTVYLLASTALCYSPDEVEAEVTMNGNTSIKMRANVYMNKKKNG